MKGWVAAKRGAVCSTPGKPRYCAFISLVWSCLAFRITLKPGCLLSYRKAAQRLLRDQGLQCPVLCPLDCRIPEPYLLYERLDA